MAIPTSSTPSSKTNLDDAGSLADGLYGLGSSPKTASAVVIPVPFDATASYRRGAALGPQAVLEASLQVDLEDLHWPAPYQGGLAMLPIPKHIEERNIACRQTVDALRLGRESGMDHAQTQTLIHAIDKDGDAVRAWVQSQANTALDAGQFACVLGGDHASPLGLLEAVFARHPNMGILHLDAHADLRVAYEGMAYSHASIMHQARALGIEKLVQVGIRDFGRAERQTIESNPKHITTYFDLHLQNALHTGTPWHGICDKIIDDLPQEVYLSWDIDGLDPSLCPHTGTPVPGGLYYPQAIALLHALVASGRTIVGFDLCEIAPGPAPYGQSYDAAVGARLLYQMLAASLTSQDPELRRTTQTNTIATQAITTEKKTK